MSGFYPLLFGFVFLAAVEATCSYAQKVKRSVPADYSKVSWDDEWEHKDVTEKVPDGSVWSSNNIGSPSKKWDAGETVHRWSHASPSSHNLDYDYSDEWQLWSHPAQNIGVPVGGNSTEKHLEAILRGVPGVDFPNYNTIPDTQFDCSEQTSRGYYGDVTAECQVFHICQAEGRKDSFLCPLGTIFNQKYFVCDWWFNFNCSDSPQYYELNEHVYKDEKDEDMKMQPRNPPGVAKGVPSKGSNGPAVFRGKSIDEWSSGGQGMKFGDKMHFHMPSRDQSSRGKGQVGKVNGNVVWNRSVGKKDVQDTTPRPSLFLPAGRMGTKSPGLATKKNGNVPNKGNIRGTWTGSNVRPSSDSVINEINKTPGKVPRPAGFGARTKNTNSAKVAALGSWKPTSETITKTTPSYKRKALSQTSNNVAWPRNQNAPRKNLQSFTTLNPATIIRPTGSRGVWEQDSAGKTSETNYMWKLDATYQKGIVRKPTTINIKSAATEINNSVTASVLSSFGKRKGITSNNLITTRNPASIKSDTLHKLNSGDSYVLASSSGTDLTRTLGSTLRDSIKEQGFSGRKLTVTNTGLNEAENTGRYEHTLMGTTVPVTNNHGVSQITTLSFTKGYGIRNPKREWSTNVVPQTKTRN